MTSEFTLSPTSQKLLSHSPIFLSFLLSCQQESGKRLGRVRYELLRQRPLFHNKNRNQNSFENYEKTKKLKKWQKIDFWLVFSGLEGSHGCFASSKDQRWTHSQVLGRSWGHWKARTRQRVALQECQEGIINKPIPYNLTKTYPRLFLTRFW